MPSSMASLFCPQTPLLPFRTHHRTRTSFPVLPLRTLRVSIPAAAAARGGAEQEVLRAVAESEEDSLPCDRTFENDSSRLTLAAAVDFRQALAAAAAAADADEHLDSSTPAMVVETVFPVSSDEHSTVSTRLTRVYRSLKFLPARKVKEKARKLRSSLSEDMVSGSASKNILAMTFRQVVLQQLWSFELVVFRPGSERDMDDLENHPREVSASSFKLSSSDERVISALAEAVCVSALQSTERNFLDKYIGRSLYNIFRWLQKPGKFASKDSSLIVTKLFDDEIVENVKSLLDNLIQQRHILSLQEMS